MDLGRPKVDVVHTVIHDLTPTKDRLAAINLSEKNRCNTCGQMTPYNIV